MMKKILPFLRGIIWKKRFLLALMAGLLAAPMAWMYCSVPRPRLTLPVKKHVEFTRPLPPSCWDNAAFPEPESSELIFSPDSKKLAVTKVKIEGSRRIVGDIQIWNVNTGEQVLCIPSDTESNIQFIGFSMAFTADSQRLVTHNGCGRVDFWNLATGQKTRDSFQVKQLQDDSDNSTIFSWGCLTSAANGEPLMLLEDRKKSRYIILDVSGGKQVGTIQMEMGERIARHFVGGLLSFAEDGRAARLWQYPSGKLCWEARIPSSWSYGLTATPDSQTLVHADDEFISVWDQSSPDGRFYPVLPKCSSRWCEALSPHGRLLVVGVKNHVNPDSLLVRLQQLFGATVPSYRYRLRMCNLRTRQLLATFHDGKSAEFSPDGRTLAITSRNNGGEIQIYDIPLPNPIWNTILYTLLAMAAMYGLVTGIKHLGMALRRWRARRA